MRRSVIVRAKSSIAITTTTMISCEPAPKTRTETERRPEVAGEVEAGCPEKVDIAVDERGSSPDLGDLVDNQHNCGNDADEPESTR